MHLNPITGKNVKTFSGNIDGKDKTSPWPDVRSIGNRTALPTSYLDTLMEGEVRASRRVCEGGRSFSRAAWGSGEKKSRWGVSWTTAELSISTPTSGRLCSPDQVGMAHDGGTRGGTFHDRMDRCRESQGWTTACSRMPERDGKDQGEDSPKQAGSCWCARHS